jgi:hypothetical protein
MRSGEKNGDRSDTPLREGCAPGESRRATVARQLSRVIEAIQKGDDEAVQAMVLDLGRQHRIFAPLALVVGALAMLFEGVKLVAHQPWASVLTPESLSRSEMSAPTLPLAPETVATALCPLTRSRAGGEPDSGYAGL